jgi:uncharacterized membrane protein SpoIIM required for sporulation
MSATITALATLMCALATLVTAIGGVWIAIANNRNLSRHVKEVRSNTDSMNADINQVKSDMFSLTSVMTGSMAVKKDP